MTTTFDKTVQGLSLEEELQQLEAEENELENRASSLELKTILLAMLGGSALILSIAALAVALLRSGDTVGSTPSAAAPAAANTSMGAAPMSGSSGMAATAPIVNGARVIKVQLGEMYVKPTATTVPAGKVTFEAKNAGILTHELMIERMPMRFEAPGKPVESAAQGMIQDMSSGQMGKMTVRLKPGKYTLFCNVPGHYAAGQHTLLTVTRS